MWSVWKEAQRHDQAITESPVTIGLSVLLMFYRSLFQEDVNMISKPYKVAAQRSIAKSTSISEGITYRRAIT